MSLTVMHSWLVSRHFSLKMTVLTLYLSHKILILWNKYLLPPHLIVNIQTPVLGRNWHESLLLIELGRVHEPSSAIHQC